MSYVSVCFSSKKHHPLGHRNVRTYTRAFLAEHTTLFRESGFHAYSESLRHSLSRTLCKNFHSQTLSPYATKKRWRIRVYHTHPTT